MLKLQDIEKKSSLSLEELVKLEESILSMGYMTPEKAREEIERFAVRLGFDDYYFRTTTIDEVFRHLIAISASELVSRYGGEGVGIQLINERPAKAVYIVEDESSKTEEIEKRIEKKYPAFRLESYRTKCEKKQMRLRIYIVTKPRFKKHKKKEGLGFENVVNLDFLEKSAPETIARYKAAWESMNNRESPYVGISDKPETGETRVMVGIHGEKIRQFLKYFSHLLSKYGFSTNRKYREAFQDQKQIYSFYLDKMSAETIEEFSRDLNAVVMLPKTGITKLFLDKQFSPQQALYALSAATFTHQFLTVYTEEYSTLNQALQDSPEAKGILDVIRTRLVKDTFSESRIEQTVLEHPDIVLLIYGHFIERLHPRKANQNLEELEKQIENRIEQDVPSQKNKTILSSFLKFNKVILKTNFFMRDRTCASFRLDPDFLNQVDFPERPFGVFFFYGREFIGFHVRFRDIARGGVRIIRSRNLTYYENNLDTLFLENYNLAMTQQKKNKDIPEGGSKGTILLKLETQDEHERAFKSYIDGLMDLIMPNEEVFDLYGKEELIFLGPDEGTAELMNWAALYANRRGYPLWKAFTTGKLEKNGGIPHDVYGMTTAGVHEYVLGVLEKLDLKEENITKFQTGGPDGDLGSNEILISRDRTIAIVDASGVLCDPDGIDRTGLTALAKKRLTVSEFDQKLLSQKGFFVSVNDKERTLPDGTLVHNGEDFRNKFHLSPLAQADLFVPCGGRPAAININNWQQLFSGQDEPRFRMIVEGANLFITEEARLRLEEHGIVVIKDASANKGGVTSSSLEVFAALALSEAEYDQHQCVQDGVVSPFRKAYVEEILNGETTPSCTHWC
jgi:glutamate dehydrogenase